MKILAIDPGSTSTKIGVFDNNTPIIKKEIHHSRAELAPFTDEMQQLDYREQLIINTLNDENITVNFDVIVGRGGLVHPIQGGVYEINDRLLEDTRHPLYHHACNLGALIADNMADKSQNCRAFIADPVVVDELDDIARITGLPQMPRAAIWHALNQRAIARRYAKEHGTKYEDLNLIVAHLGGGISLAAHRKGRAVDVNNALIGEGPFSPERSGTLPVNSLIELCYSGKYTQDEVIQLVKTKSGLFAHLGTNDIPEILSRIENGESHTKLVLTAMIYQVAKGIGSLATVFYGKVDAILLTGGITYSNYITNRITERVRFIAPVYVYAGEDELTSLAANAYAAILGKIPINTYR